MRYGFWIITALIVALDQWTKELVKGQLPLYAEPTPLVPGLVYLTHVQNRGVAFGQLQGAGFILVLVTLVAIACILSFRARLLRGHTPPHPLVMNGLALTLAGAIGNLIDRVRFGYVTDFIDLRWWPVFNVADSSITVGAVILAAYYLFLNQPEPELSVSNAE